MQSQCRNIFADACICSSNTIINFIFNSTLFLLVGHFILLNYIFCHFHQQIFLRELISNASDALDKIRLLSLTDSNALDATSELSIRIKADKENNVLHVTDTGIGMSHDDLINQLGTIAKSGTSEFFQKMQVSV